MNDPISRQAAINGADEIIGRDRSGNNNVVKAMTAWKEWVKGLPSAEPVKHEECEYVITKGKAGYHEEYKCSFCGDSFYWTPSEMFPNRFNYCRNCGRKIVKFIDESKG